MNTDSILSIPNYNRAKISSQIRLTLRWNTFEEYISSFRSHYRYRYKHAMKKGDRLQFRILKDNEEFSEKLYSYYTQVHDRSRYQVEMLGIEFFRKTQAKILVASIEGNDAGFVQMAENGPELIFLFVGIDYIINHQYDIYHNLLLQMVRYGIENDFNFLELGQTAEDTKLKLGGEFLPLYCLLHHSNPFINWFIGRITGLISYREPESFFHLFREDPHP